MAAAAQLPVRYSADIRTGGQCRNNLAAWRGVWSFALAGQPPENREEPGPAGAPEPPPCAVVLAHRRVRAAATETRWYGSATRQFYCGDVACIRVEWRRRCTDVPVSSDLGAAPAPRVFGGSAPAAATVADVTDDTDAPTALQHGLLIRDGYLLLGDSRTFEHDDCIKLELVAGTSIE